MAMAPQIVSGVLALLLVADAAHAANWTVISPEMKTGEFMTWCQEHGGFEAKDPAGDSCWHYVGRRASTVTMFGKGSGCEILQTKRRADEKATAAPVFEWLRASRDKLTGNLSKDIAAGYAAVYRCDDR